MREYQFTLIVPVNLQTDEEVLAAADALGDAGCTDASACGSLDGMELIFSRSANSLQAAIASAIADVERAGFRVAKVKLEREAVMN